MKIAVTGASGFVGRWLIQLLEPTHTLTAMGVEPTPDFFTERNTPFIQTGFTQPELTPHLKGHDALIHLAAVRPQKGAPFPTGLNEELTHQVALAAHQAKVPHVLFASSRMVYDPCTDPIPFKEEAANGESPYGLSKRACEEILFRAGEQQGTKVTVLRLAQVLGLGERGGYMDTIFFKRARAGLPLEVFGKGAGRRHYVYVKDVVSAFEQAITTGNTGIFNVGMEHDYSHLEFAKTMNRVFGRESTINFKSVETEDEAVWRMSLKRTREILRWSAHYDLEAAITDMRREAMREQ